MFFVFFISEDTSKFHRALVFSDGNAIYQADIRSVTAVFSTYEINRVYESTLGTIQFLTLDMVDRNVIFATDTQIYSLKIDMLNALPQLIVSSTSVITGTVDSRYLELAYLE